MTTESMKSFASALSFWIGVFLFSVYLLSFSGKLHVMDELAVFTAGNNLAQHGRADINQLIWTNHWTPHAPGIWGQDGNLYTKKAPGISIVTAPLIWLGHALPGLNAVHVALLTNIVVTALTGSLLLIWLLDLGFARRTAILTSLGYGLCTIAWVYARMFWELSILGLCFLVTIWAIRRATEPTYANHQRRWLLLAGGAMALGLTLRFETAVAVLLVGTYLWWCSRPGEAAKGRTTKDKPTPNGEGQMIGTHALRFATQASRPGLSLSWSTLRSLGLYLLLPAIISLGLAYFNMVRYGSLGETGYTQEFLFLEPWVGAYGLLFSPGNGLFLYAPLMLLLFFGLRPAWRRLSRPYFWLIAAVCLFYWIFYGSWFSWGGVWVWGPRFFLPTLPLLMLFVAEPLERMMSDDWGVVDFMRPVAWIGLAVLVLSSLAVNLLGIAVDFNEHFLRLGRNDNFIFNWTAFPPLGHWQILQEGLIDIIWLRPTAEGLAVEWAVLIPALILFGLAALGLSTAVSQLSSRRETLASRWVSHPASLLLMTLLAIGFTYQMMTATARVALADDQAPADLPLLETVSISARPDDALLIAMPPFGDVQELTTRTMAYLDRPLPVFAWIESEPRAIQPEERERVWQAAHAQAGRVWLFERWLTPNDPRGTTAARFNREAFPVQAQWFEQSGRLSLYALADDTHPSLSASFNVRFAGGLELLDLAVFDNPVAPGEVLKVRLTWRIPKIEQFASDGLPGERIVAFVHLLDNGPTPQNVAQQDRLLLDLQNVEQSPLLPGQIVPQGYGLQLPADLPPGSYPLIAGVYSAETGQRLPRADGSPDDFLYLINITVE